MDLQSSVLACRAGRARSLFLRSKGRAAFEAVAGLAMIAFGLKLAMCKARA
jgi:threonine/homoserine/homoserine lactone efflux protein